MNTKLIVFDLDGTLINSIEGLAVSMNRVLDTYGYKNHSLDDYKGFVGNGIKNLVCKALPQENRDDQTINKCFEQMIDAYRLYYNVGMHIYPGVEDLLDRLSGDGLLMAINTNKNQLMTDMIVKEFLHRWSFIKVIGEGKEFAKKPSPNGVLDIVKTAGCDVEECVFIGDSEVDIITAKNAGMRSIIVTWGFRSKEELLTHQPEVLIDKPDEILALIN